MDQEKIYCVRARHESRHHAGVQAVAEALGIWPRQPMTAHWGVPDPKLVVVIGDCGACDGLFDSSYASRGSVENVIPVHRKIHGCPPNPGAIRLGIFETVCAVRIES